MPIAGRSGSLFHIIVDVGLTYLLYLTYCGVGVSNQTGITNELCIRTLTTHQAKAKAKATSDDSLQEPKDSNEKDSIVATFLSDQTATKRVEALRKVLRACSFLLFLTAYGSTW